MNLLALPLEAGHRRVERVPEFLFLGVEVANGVALLDRAPVGDRARRSEQRFRQGGFAGRTVPYQCDSTKIDGNVLTHVFSQ